MKIFCPDCGTQAILEPESWRCQCGGAWETVLPDTFDPALIDTTETSVWRYKRLYGLDFDQPKIVMGAGWTPLLPLTLDDRPVFVKPEYFAPTASFKDRGTELMINILAHQGVTHIAEDSSGNAGASVAAFSARSGIKAEIFVPAHASPAKQAQIAVYGANVNPIPGPRVNAKLAAIDMVEKGVTFASHAFHPGFLLGQQSVAYELWEQLGHRAPDWYIVPVGQGVHLLGVWLGFKRLFRCGFNRPDTTYGGSTIDLSWLHYVVPLKPAWMLFPVSNLWVPVWLKVWPLRSQFEVAACCKLCENQKAPVSWWKKMKFETPGRKWLRMASTSNPPAPRQWLP